MFIESSLQDLYLSTVSAFPQCGLRQNATHPIIIKNLTWVPFLGLKTLFVKSLAQNEEREYNPIILFKNVNYDGNEVLLKASDGKQYNFDRISLENSDVLVRCNCKDFSYRFNFYNHLDKSLYGRKRTKYESKGGPPANPSELPGACKHLWKTVHVLKEAKIFVEF
jgi:hypothetical protein